MTRRYYSERLCAERLELCYEVAPPRVRRYLWAEIEHLLSLISVGATVLELGCGYGRVFERIANVASVTCGISCFPGETRGLDGTLCLGTALPGEEDR